MKNKILAILMVGILIATFFTSCFSANATSLEKKELISVDVENNNAEGALDSMETAKKIGSSNGDDIDRWAVIVGVGDYVGKGLDLTGVMEIWAMTLYELLQEKDNRWTPDNIRLLTDESATKQNITDALDWLKENAGESDIVLFFFGGHGTYVKDEPPYDESDKYDEAICPHEYYRDKEGIPHNYITDDELSTKFDAISENNIEGMFLIFDSCLSGSLVNWSRKTSSVESLPAEGIIGMSNEILSESNNGFTTGLTSNTETLTSEQMLNQLLQESNSYTTGMLPTEEPITIEEIIERWNRAVQDANSFTAGLTEDISVDGRVVATSSVPQSAVTIAFRWLDILEELLFGDEEYLVPTFGMGVCKALEKGRSTAEGISQYAKYWWQLRWWNIALLFSHIFTPKLLIIGFYIYVYFSIDYVYFQLPFAMWKDGYPADDPSSAKLTIIGDGDGNNQNSQSNSQQSSTSSSSQLLQHMVKTTKTTNR